MIDQLLREVLGDAGRSVSHRVGEDIAEGYLRVLRTDDRQPKKLPAPSLRKAVLLQPCSDQKCATYPLTEEGGLPITNGLAVARCIEEGMLLHLTKHRRELLVLVHCVNLE